MYRTLFLKVLGRFARRTEGQDLIEYALLTGILSIALIVSITGLGSKVGQLYATTSAALNGAPSSDPGAGGDPGQGTPGDPGSPGNGNPNPGNGNPNPGNGNPNPGNGNPNPGNGNPNPGKGKG